MTNVDKINTGGGTFVQGDVNAEGEFIGRDKVTINITNLEKQSLSILYEMITGIKNNNFYNRKTTFEFHIQPIFQRLEKVHKDYEMNLFGLQNQVAKRNSSLEKSAQWLVARSLKYRSDRRLLENVDKELNLVARILQNDLEFANEISVFCKRVLFYFNLKDTLQLNDSQIDNRLYISHGTGHSVLGDVLTSEKLPFETVLHLIEQINHHLQFNWRLVTDSYMTLKGLCFIAFTKT